MRISGKRIGTALAAGRRMVRDHTVDAGQRRNEADIATVIGRD
jgi:hypothetical protein